MSQLWWQMPGPRRFSEEIAERLGDGKNVVVGMPKSAPEGLGQALERLSARVIRREWHALRVKPGSRTAPARLLFAKFAPEAAGSILHTAANLARESAFAGKIIWIEGLEPENWPAWRQFLTDYEHACRSVSEYRRTVFCVVAGGSTADDPPPANIGLDIVCYRGVADQLDALLYAASNMPSGGPGGLKRRVAIAAIAQLAQWDPAVSDRLVRYPLRRIVSPQDILADLARERGWSPDMTMGWSAGAVDVFEGQQRRHAALIACSGDCRELEQRVWSAQVGVLFPAIEQRRHELIQELTPYLTVPFQTRGAVIESLFGLELSHIEWQLVAHQRDGRQDPQLRRALPVVRELKAMRNALAHMQVLSEEHILL